MNQLPIQPFNLANTSDSCLPEGPQILQVGSGAQPITFATGAEQYVIDGSNQIFRKLSALRTGFINTKDLTAGTVRLSFNSGLLNLDFFSNSNVWFPIYVPVPFQLVISSPNQDAVGDLSLNLYNFRIIPFENF
jgi:hypothetical protein